MSEELEEYDAELAQIVSEIKHGLLVELPKQNGRMKIEKCDALKAKIAKGKTALKSYQIELRAWKAKEGREEWELKAKSYETDLLNYLQDVQWAYSSAEKDDLFGRKKEVTAKDMTQAAIEIQKESIASTSRAQNVLSETIQIGQETAVELKKQTEQIEEIGKKVDTLETNLRRAQKQVRVFFRRMASDKIVLGLILLAVMGICGAIAVSVVPSLQK